MAFKITDKVNTDSPDSLYPYGNIRDDSGTGDGTPVDKKTYADFHQFFARLMAIAGLSFNSLAENAYNGFQYITALLAVISQQMSSIYRDIAGAEATTVNRRTKIIALPVWNMDVDAGKSVNHGITKWQTITAKVIVINDLGTKTYDLCQMGTYNTLDGVPVPIMGGFISEINSTQIVVNRSETQAFDGPDFDSVVASRGFIEVSYEL